MTSSLLELQDTRPFDNLRLEVWLNLQRTSAVLSHGIEHQLRPLGLSRTQYNVLRILRDAGETGLCQCAIGERLVAQVPDVPRILERMERAGWIRRERADQNRRLVIATLSETGVALVDALDRPMQKIMDGMFPGIDEAHLVQLNDLLVAARTGDRLGL